MDRVPSGTTEEFGAIPRLHIALDTDSRSSSKGLNGAQPTNNMDNGTIGVGGRYIASVKTSSTDPRSAGQAGNSGPLGRLWK